MGRAVFVLLLASCFATGHGLQCYQCVSDLSVLLDGFDLLPIGTDDCNSASFDPDTVNTMTVTGSGDTSVPLLKAEYCVKMVISFEGLVGVTIRSGMDSAALMNPGAVLLMHDGNGTYIRQHSILKSLIPDNLIPDNLLPSSDLMGHIDGLFQNPPSPLGAVDISLCDSNMCNSVSGLGHSNALLAMAAVVILLAARVGNRV